MVVTDFCEAESGSELLSGLPCDTGLERHGIVACVVKQTEVAAEVHEQRELLTDGATHVTDVRLQSQRVGGDSLFENLGLIETVASAKSHLPMVVDHVTHLRSDGETRGILLNACTEAATDPNLCVSSEDACKGKS